MRIPQPLVDAFADIVAKTSTQVLATLQENEPSIVGVRYDYGHWLELQEDLVQLDNASEEYKLQKYPLIMLLEDIPINRNTGYWGIADFTLLICNSTNKDWKSRERQENNFNPILNPTYEALNEQIAISPYFVTRGQYDLQETVTDRKYLGRVQLAGNYNNTMVDFIDAKEVRYRLTVDYDSCLQAINFLETT